MKQSASFHLSAEHDNYWHAVNSLALSEHPLQEGVTLTQINNYEPFSQKIALSLIASGLETQRVVARVGDMTLFINAGASRWLQTEPQKSDAATWSHEVVMFHREHKWCYHLASSNWTIETKLDPQAIFQSPHKDWLAAWGFVGLQSTGNDNLGKAFNETLSRPDGQYVAKEVQPQKEIEFPSKLKFNIDLVRATTATLKQNWGDILSKRNSNLTEQTNLSLQQWGELLDLCFSAQQLSNRNRYNYGSAGGFYPLYVLVKIPRTETLAAGIYVYHPLKHKLALVQEMNVDTEAGTIYLASSMNKLREKYQNIPTRLQLLNTGVIYHQISLAAASLNLQGQPYGGIPPKDIELLVKAQFTNIESLIGLYQISGK